LHANSAVDVPARLEALALAAGLDRAATHSQLASGVAAVVHLARGRDGVRRLAEIAVPRRGGDGLVTMVPAVNLVEGELREGAGAAELARVLGL
jgi:pilus assembly protein CpaF